LGVNTGEIMETESKLERIKMAMEDTEYGPEEEISSLQDILKRISRSVEENLLVMEACSEVKIRDVKVNSMFITIEFECDGEVYKGKWRWDKLTIYTARFNKLE
jgi:hypothetical protein